MEEKRKRIGIMGGTFDPIHYGHLLIAENAAAQYSLDEVWFMPTGHSPHKVQTDISDALHRCAMIERAISDNPIFQLSHFEIESGETNYTYRTLGHLRALYPENDFYFILGGDSLKALEEWRKPERILQTAYILAAIRDDVEGSEFLKQIEHLNKKYSALGVFPLTTPNFSVSSRNIRDLVKKQKTIRYMLPEGVREYIDRHALYQEIQ